MKSVEELIKSIHNGTLDITELSAEEAEQVLSGYREAAFQLLENPKTKPLGEAIIKILVDAGLEDPFEIAIEEAESRGNTYWEFETDRIH